jgi:hypothetical protein
MWQPGRTRAERLKPEKRKVRKQVKGGGGAGSDGGSRIERGADLMECRLEAEGEEDV